MKTLSERASYLLELAGNSTKELARIAGVRPPSVSQWVNGETKSIQLLPATKLGKHFGLSPLWVSKGIPPMRDVLPSSDTVEIPPMSYSSPQDDNIEIRHFETGGSMGTGVLLRDQPGVIASWLVSPEWLQKNVRHHSGQKICAS